MTMNIKTEVRDIPQILADQLGVTRQELLDYLQFSIFPQGCFKQDSVMELCRVCIENRLSPFAGHVYVMTRQNRAKGNITVTVGIKTSGWTKILNDQPLYDGMELLFSQTTINWGGATVPEYLTVKIYKKNQRFPFTEIFRFVEWVQGNNPVWKTQPLAMFQKRAMASAVRDCFGLGVLMDEENEVLENFDESNPNQAFNYDVGQVGQVEQPMQNANEHSKLYDAIKLKIQNLSDSKLVNQVKNWLTEKFENNEITNAELNEFNALLDDKFNGGEVNNQQEQQVNMDMPNTNVSYGSVA